MSIISGQSYFSAPGAGVGTGSASVFTHTSSYTTQSTRPRRPGAAKERLAKAKEAEENRRRGWHESMESAAASTHRVWKAKDGWVDYTDQEKCHSSFDDRAAQTSDEKYHIPLHVFAKSKKNKKKSAKNSLSSASASSNSAIPFPVRWEKERTEMLGGSDLSKSQNSIKHSEKEPPKRQTRDSPFHKSSMISPDIRRVINDNPSSKNQSVFRERRVVSLSPMRETQQDVSSLSLPRVFSRPVPSRPIPAEQSSSTLSGTTNWPETPMHSGQVSNSPARSTRSKGWIETMREATANLAKDGHKWDPKQGFANLDAISTSDVIIVNSTCPSAIAKDRHNHPLQIRTTEKTTPETPSQECQRNDPPGRKNLAGDTRTSYIVPQNGTPRKTTMSHLGSVGKPPEKKDMQSASQEKDMGDIGGFEEKKQDDCAAILRANARDDRHYSVQEPIEITPEGVVEADFPGIAALNYEEDEDYMLTPSAPLIVTPNINVKKEKVRAEDIDFFPKFQVQSSHPGPLCDGTTQNSRPKLNNATQSKSDRRNSGPVDIDEVDAISSDESDTSDVWNSTKFEDDSFLQGTLWGRDYRAVKAKTKMQARDTKDESVDNCESEDKLEGNNCALEDNMSTEDNNSGVEDKSESNRSEVEDELEDKQSGVKDKEGNQSELQDKSEDDQSEVKDKSEDHSSEVKNKSADTSYEEKNKSADDALWPDHARKLARSFRNRSNKESSSQEAKKGERTTLDKANGGEMKYDDVPCDLQNPYLNARRPDQQRSLPAPALNSDRKGPISVGSSDTTKIRTLDAKGSSSLNICSRGNANDEASHMRNTSSVTAGWKSFLNKKVQAESAVAATAAKYHYKPCQDYAQKEESRDSKTKKAVSFASDVSDSLLDESSIFDFSSVDSKNSCSPRRRRDDDVGGGQVLEQKKSDSCHSNFPSVTERIGSYEKASYSPNRRQIHGDDKHSYSARNQSFDTSVSPISEEDDGAKSAVGPGPHSGQQSFLKRLSECAAPVLAPQPCHTKEGAKDTTETSKGDTIAYNLYLRGSKAAEKVEEMMGIMRSRRCSAGRRNVKPKDDDDSNASFRERLSARLQVSSSRSDLAAGLDNDPDKAFEDLAKARVEAMLNSLYYEE